MRYLELLIEESRLETGNTRYSDDSGVSQRTFRQRFQNAQDFFVREVIISKCKYFLERVTRVVVPGQSEYTYQSDCFMQGIDSIQWSSDGSSWGEAFTKCISKDQNSSNTGYPFGYIPIQDGFILNPPLNSGYLLESYNRRPKRLEKRSGLVVSTTGTPITSITLDASFAGHDPTYLNKFQTIAIVGADGIPKTPSVPISAVSGTSITVSNYTLASGEAIAAGDYVLAEGNSTNVPGYDDTVESFLLMHVNYQTKYGDASQWSKESKEDMKMHASQIIAVLSSMNEDVTQVPIVNTDYLMMY